MVVSGTERNGIGSITIRENTFEAVEEYVHLGSLKCFSDECVGRPSDMCRRAECGLEE